MASANECHPLGLDVIADRRIFADVVLRRSAGPQRTRGVPTPDRAPNIPQLGPPRIASPVPIGSSVLDRPSEV